MADNSRNAFPAPAREGECVCVRGRVIGNTLEKKIQLVSLAECTQADKQANKSMGANQHFDSME